MNKDIYHLDYETYSPENIDSGAFKYAEHPEAEILIMTIAKNEEPPLPWSVLDEDIDALMLLQEAVESGRPIWAHNAQFEYAASKTMFLKTFKFNPPSIEQWHCTQALCRRAAIPSSLKNAGEFLEIEMPKDGAGKKLIDKFCKPRKPTRSDPRTRIMPQDEPEEFQKFVDYCVRDVIAERQVYHKIHRINQPNPSHASFVADMRMNERGIPLNIKALTHANKLLNEYKEKLIPLFREQTKCVGETVTMPVTKQRKFAKEVSLDEGFKPSQNEMMKTWMKGEGFTGDDLQAQTVELWLTEPNLKNQLSERAFKALKTYALVGSAAVKKIPAMLDRASADEYVRGALIIYGAERTHRWTGSGIQPQNFARPVIEFTELAYSCICNEASLEDMEAMFGDLFPILVSVIRHFIQPHDGKMVLQADYSAIEARVAPWLVGAEETLERFRNKEPLYEIMASLIFNKPVSQVTKDERFIGKQAVLGCSYQMGRPKFRSTCESYGFSPPHEMVEDYKPRHQAFVNRAIAKVESEIVRKFENRGMALPAKFDKLFFIKKACKENNWPNITPETFEEWQHFTFDDLADRAVTAWRKENPVIVPSWRKLDDTAKRAIAEPNEIFHVGKLQIMSMQIANFQALCIKLPSGHYLIYPKAEVVKNEKKGWGTQIRFWGVMPNTGGNWGWCHTYGGKLLENCTQAAAGDVMREGMLAAEAEGYLPFMLVHDELLATQEEGQTHERLCELLCTMPGWADGLPLEAEGSTIPFYKK